MRSQNLLPVPNICREWLTIQKRNNAINAKVMLLPVRIGLYLTRKDRMTIP